MTCVTQGSLNMKPCSENTITVQSLKEQVKSSVCTTCQGKAALLTKPEWTCNNAIFWERRPLSLGSFPPMVGLSLDLDYTTQLETEVEF